MTENNQQPTANTLNFSKNHSLFFRLISKRKQIDEHRKQKHVNKYENLHIHIRQSIETDSFMFSIHFADTSLAQRYMLHIQNSIFVFIVKVTLSCRSPCFFYFCLSFLSPLSLRICPMPDATLMRSPAKQDKERIFRLNIDMEIETNRRQISPACMHRCVAYNCIVGEQKRKKKQKKTNTNTLAYDGIQLLSSC